MNKEFIPYEQALALKELGFNEHCFGYFYTEDKFFETKIKNSELDEECSISAPTFSQAFRWFREKYGLVVTNPPTEMSNLIYFKATIYKYKPIRLGNTVDVLYNKTFKTYEEAELECLKRLIEIIKSK
jgi:hypothetical protein